MRNTPNDGGPAFPHSTDDATAMFQKGMTLRDYFAAAALTGLIASELGGVVRTDEQAAVCAYKQADAMLAERDRKP